MNKQLGMKLLDLNKTLAKVLIKRFDELGLDITPVQSRIITAIYEHGNSICQKQLESKVFRNKSTLSSVLDNMEKNGYIKRIESESDSRKKLIVLTDKAYQIVDKLNEDRETLDKIMCEGISDSEYNSLCTILDKIKENLERV